MVEVVVRDAPLSKGPIFYYHPSVVTFVGELLPNPKHVSNDCITLSCNDFIPYRVIRKRDIISIGGKQVIYTTKPSVMNSWQVNGSNGKEYTVTNSNDSWSCTCAGFSFRKECKHITLLQKKNHE